ncbi:hypothetical protein IE53DRAFT_313283 [Violaceomyces palustris]|uniref:Uncharacterized protein n=1 Tax=Violaceomyces palustris TaxID=1673888 RepID=A0ACD0P139_9BASI|nr:hypothetical protein IE53DRAFT_313283 [Violaceomyces palustris]
MYYISHAHKSSATIQSLLLPNFLPSGPSLCLVHHSSLSFLALPGNSSSSAPLFSQLARFDLNARIISVSAVAHRLVLLTDHHMPRLIVLRHASAQESSSSRPNGIITEASLLLDEMARAPAELGLGLWVEQTLANLGADSGPRAIVSHTHCGLLRVLPLASSSEVKQRARQPLSLDSEPNLMDDRDEEGLASTPGLGSTRVPDAARAFSVRLPHPTLISASFLQPRDNSFDPTLALLSLSSVPSRIPGLGGQCLPVLSFYSLDMAGQEICPVAWGPPRKVPANLPPPPAPASRTSSGSMPGAYSIDQGQDETGSAKPTASSRDVKKKHGPSAMGARLDEKALRQREEKLAKNPTTRAHVPLPYADALGAHLLHPIPARAGGGVLVFGETSIIYVPPPSRVEKDRRPSQHQSQLSSSSVVEAPKRRKGSSSDHGGGRRRSSAAGAAIAAAPAEENGDASGSPLPSSPTVKSNANGKRRRSSAIQMASSPTSAKCPSSPIDGTSSAGASGTKLLRLSLPFPVQVTAATTIIEPAGSDGAVLNVLFSCNAGSLEMLTVKLACKDNEEGTWQPRSMTARHLGPIPQAAGPGALTYLGESFLHVSSATGDSVLVRVDPADDQAEGTERSEAQMVSPPTSPPTSPVALRRLADYGGEGLDQLEIGGKVTEIQRWPNLGPIVDFVVDDGEGGDPSSGSSPQSRIVTCSGSGPTGSLRIVRNGVGLEKVVDIDLPDAKRLWSINVGESGDPTTVMILAGYSDRTDFYRFSDDGGLEDVSASFAEAGVIASSRTLCAASLPTGQDGSHDVLFIHATGQKLQLVGVSPAGINAVSEWSPSSLGGEERVEGKAEITCAAANELGQVLVALRGGHLVHLKVDRDSIGFVSRTKFEHEVACLDASTLAEGQEASICAVGFWQTNSAQIFSLPNLDPVGQSSFADERHASLPRSILLHCFSNQGHDTGSGSPAVVKNTSPHLLIGLGDGTLTSYSLSLPTAESYSSVVGISDRKSVSLGSLGLRLEKFKTSHGVDAIFVSGDKPTVVSTDSSNVRLVYSSIKYRNVSSVAPLYAVGRPSSLALALPEFVQVANIGAVQKLDIRTVDLGCEQPLAITAHHPAKAFGVVTWTFLPRGSFTKKDRRGAVRIVDQVDLRTLDEFWLEKDERANCIETVRLNGRDYLVIGTGFTEVSRNEITRGRLIGFIVQPGRHGDRGEERKFKLAFEAQVPGNVYGLAGVGGRLAAAINSEVRTFDVVGENGSAKGEDLRLKLRGLWGCAFVACTLTCSEPGKGRLVVGDALRSMNVLEVDQATGKITELARDCDPFWTTSADIIDEETQTYIGSDIAFNLFTTQRVKLGEEAKNRIKRAKEEEMESGRSSAAPSSNLVSEREGFGHVMARQGVYHYGDMINRFRRGEAFWYEYVTHRIFAFGFYFYFFLTSTRFPIFYLPSTSKIKTLPSLSETKRSPAGSPRIVFGTASGSIGIIAHVPASSGRLLSKLERNMEDLMDRESIGGIKCQEWRTLRTDHRVQAPVGFLDGDLLQHFVTGLDRSRKSFVVEGCGNEAKRIDCSVEEVDGLLEALGQLC